METNLQFQLKMAPKSIYLQVSTDANNQSDRDREESEQMATRLVVNNLRKPIVTLVDSPGDQKKSTVLLGMYLETGHGLYGLAYDVPLVFQFHLDEIKHLTALQLKRFISSEVKTNTSTTATIMKHLKNDLLSLAKTSKLH